ATGLREWQSILGSEQAETLRQVLAADIQQAEMLITDPNALPALLISERQPS
ncbi:MAG: hypothetical protein H7Y11_11155, partial [Armatimonadetes bacterium]|nr:hypothetical protein [Anaerolineae bacterium]